MYSACLDGFNPFEVRIECYVGRGLPSFKVVGLPDAGVKEAIDRVYSAIRCSDLHMPCAKVVINLSPSDLRKAGTHLDLPICLALLSAGESREGGQVPTHDGVACFGELSLYGEVVATPGLIPLLLGLSQRGYGKFIVPFENLQECRAIQVGQVIGVRNLHEALAALAGHINEDLIPFSTDVQIENRVSLDYGDVKGCDVGKRVMEIAAAGRHHTLLLGPPGTGKTMLASRVAGILPEPTWDEILEITRIHNMAGIQRQGLMTERPFRTPHYTITQAGFIGGYAHLAPGEVSLAHNGVLFLDELTEFKREVLESLRTLLEQRSLVLRRGKRYYEIPCDFLMMAAANPCPCGYFGSSRECTCRQSQRERYMARISGPVADRIDLKYMMVDHLTSSHLAELSNFESETMHRASALTSFEMRTRVKTAWVRQTMRNAAYGVICNSDLPSRGLMEVCLLKEKTVRYFEKSIDRLKLSRRSIDKILKVSRTIADLDQKDQVDESALREAILYNASF